MSTKSVERNPDFILGWRRVAKIFQVSERTVRRWAERAEVRPMLLIKAQIAIPREHLYFFWLRVCRHHEKSYHMIAMANAGCVLLEFLRNGRNGKKLQINERRGGGRRSRF